MINAERLQAVLTLITDNPELHRQDSWTCGTAACFAGWTTRLFGAEEGWINLGLDGAATCGSELWRRNGINVGTRDLAASLLGLSPEQSGCLFNGGNTIRMIELMVKDIVNDDPMRHVDDYRRESEA